VSSILPKTNLKMLIIALLGELKKQKALSKLTDL
jgi:hypothetical protein